MNEANGNIAEPDCRAERRQRLYKLLAIGKRDLRLKEDEYRSILYGNGAQLVDDKWSAKTMSILQLEDALEHMKRLGFRPSRRKAVQDKREGDWRDPRIKKAYAIWCALSDARVVKNRSWKGLNKWAYNITRTATLDWANPNDLNAVIEGLKSWAAREGVKLEHSS